MLWVLVRITSVRYYAPHLGEAILMSTHTICFYGELSKIILQLSSDTLLIYSTVSCTNLQAFYVLTREFF